MVYTTNTISSSLYGKEFFYKMWENRHDLSDYERKGFAQYFYITMSGHVESILVVIIKARLKTINRESENWKHSKGFIKININKVEKFFPIDPIPSSVISIVSSLEKRVEKASLFELLKIYDEVFSKNTLKQAVGNDIKRGLEAIAQLRNVFAHGRDILMYFESDNFNNFDDFSVNLDKCSLGEPIKYLKKEKIFDGTIKWNTDLSVFFEDKVIFHFYNVIRKFEHSLIKKMPEFECPFGCIPGIDNLPVLEL